MNDYEWIIEVTPPARAAISREIKAQWDGRELGGALVGHTHGERIVVTDANGIGVGGDSSRRDLDDAGARALARFRARVRRRPCWRLALPPWRRHPVPSDQDVKSWQATREVLGSPAYVGLIFLPHKVLVQGIHYDEVVWSFRQPEVGEYVITQAGSQRTRFVLSGGTTTSLLSTRGGSASRPHGKRSVTAAPLAPAPSPCPGALVLRRPRMASCDRLRGAQRGRGGHEDFVA